MPEGGWAASKSDAGAAKEKKPIFGDFPKSEDSNIVWRFSRVDFQWDLLKVAEFRHGISLSKFFCKIKKFESMRVQDMFSGRPGKCYPFDDKLPPHLGERLENLGYEELSEIHCLRVGSKERIFGILEKNVFYVLWWDLEHRVWPSSKKRT